jgi:Trk-type K+ transport system membrane component
MSRLTEWARRHPGGLILAAYLAAVAVGTLLLLAPAAARPGASPSVLSAVFTATSALTVTGLTVVDTGTAWSTSGHVVILLLIQLGGLGIMVVGALLGLVVAGRLGLRSRMLAATEAGGIQLGDVRRVARGAVLVTLAVEAAVALLLTARLALPAPWGLGVPGGRAAWLGVFHSVSAFNNAGFALWSDSLAGFAGDAGMLVPVMAAIVAGSLGFPVMLELARKTGTWRGLSLHSKLTVTTTAILLVVGWVLFALLEWGNQQTFGALGSAQRVLSAAFAAVTPRTAGMATFDYAEATPATRLVTDVLMVVGGGSAGTSGGIKVTTLALLVVAVVAEARGQQQVEAFGRSIPTSSIRQALAVAVLSVLVLTAAAVALLQVAHITLDAAVFEVVSAFTTTGLSTGLTGTLPPAGQLLLVVLMLVGRVGPISVASALARRTSGRLYRLPEERPIVG